MAKPKAVVADDALTSAAVAVGTALGRLAAKVGLGAAPEPAKTASAPKAPAKKKAPPQKKPAVKKTAVKKVAAKKAATKKPVAKKARKPAKKR